MKSLTCLLITLTFLSSAVMAVEYQGWVELEGRYFPDDTLYPGQDQNSASVATQPEFYQEWKDGDSFNFVPFYRYDSADDQRTKFDIREAIFFMPRENYELSVGVGKVFWGVTEAVSLVNIVNQTDAVESLSGDEKLGQPMINLTLLGDEAVLDLFVLPYFRERTFSGRGGRLRFEPFIDTTRPAAYENADKQKHVDYAFRYSNTLGDVDIGISGFYGTTREPAYLASIDSNGNLNITPFYEIVSQGGLDLQYINEGWLWKLEAIYRDGLADGSFYQADAGFEYTFSGLGMGGADVGLIMEYIVDSRDFNLDVEELLTSGYISSRFNTFLNNDYLVGLRLALNDFASTELLVGYIQDIDSRSSIFQIEASRRFGERWKLELDAFIFADVEKDPLLNFFRNDSFVQFAMKYYF